MPSSRDLPDPGIEPRYLLPPALGKPNKMRCPGKRISDNRVQILLGILYVFLPESGNLISTHN